MKPANLNSVKFTYILMLKFRLVQKLPACTKNKVFSKLATRWHDASTAAGRAPPHVRTILRLPAQ